MFNRQKPRVQLLMFTFLVVVLRSFAEVPPVHPCIGFEKERIRLFEKIQHLVTRNNSPCSRWALGFLSYGYGPEIEYSSKEPLDEKRYKEEMAKRIESFSEIFPLLLEESRLGNPHANYVLGFLYSAQTQELDRTMNFWTRIDSSRSFGYFSKAAKAGLAPAMAVLGEMLYLSAGEKKTSFISNSERLAWLLKGAEMGYPLAQLHLSWNYDHLIGPGFEHICPHDLNQALYWAEMALKCSFGSGDEEAAGRRIRTVREHIETERTEKKLETEGKSASEGEQEPLPEGIQSTPEEDNQ